MTENKSWPRQKNKRRKTNVIWLENKKLEKKIREKISAISLLHDDVVVAERSLKAIVVFGESKTIGMICWKMCSIIINVEVCERVFVCIKLILAQNEIVYFTILKLKIFARKNFVETIW